MIVGYYYTLSQNQKVYMLLFSLKIGNSEFRCWSLVYFLPKATFCQLLDLGLVSMCF